MALITAQRVRKEYRVGETSVAALKGLSFQIDKGAFISFVGPSGSGKTTLLNLIGCLDTPTEGRLEVAGVDVSTLDRGRRALFRGKNIGFVFQDFNLVPILTVFENVEYPLVMVQSLPSVERHKRVTTLLQEVGMLDQKDKFPDQLSGGQKQRVAIARALVTGPQLVLADEPTANLDHKTAHLVIKLMKTMRDEMNTTFIFSTHDQKIVGEAETLYLLEDGLLIDTQVNKGHGNA
jgi:putative ABC transport system ATP-binding protein